ncbi:MAG: pilus assembly protein N-terminal domain-containing protein [Alphaproteobacteria bacterium]|nr:pilus assembly protein N-terminal domain-containing protein [Alphaproteobacteria bacterium]
MKCGLALVPVLLVASLGQAAARDLAVPEDEARIVKFDKPVATVYVADPVVADVNMIDTTHAFLLGKSYGATNLIAMDAQGNPIESRHVTVFGSSHLVTLNRGPNQFTFACASVRCETATAPGDVRTWHDDDMAEIEKREDMGAKQASANEGHQN